MTELEKRSFISKVAELALKYAPQYGIKYVSPIIAQACLESGWGKSGLASYNNLFGMKCGRYWKGSSINMNTKEEYTPGTLTSISANFRTYANLEEGIKGYFEFIQAKRYANLKDAVSAEDYCEKLKLDGWATSSTYVKNLIAIISTNNLKNYDEFLKTVLNGGKIETSTHIISGEVKTYKPVSDAVVTAVIRGNYGNGAVRKQKLEAEGYSYSEIQAAVNKRLKG